MCSRRPTSLLAVGDHLPIELAQRAADLTAQIEQGA
jgi:hypothetical protein